MKFIICLFAAMACGCDALASDISCDKKINALQVELASDRLTFSLRDSISLSLKIINNGFEPVSLSPHMELEYYWIRFDVVDSSGMRVRWLGPEIKLIETPDRVMLYKGYYWGRQFAHIEKSYDLSRVGTYRIRAVYGVGPDGVCSNGMAVSDWLKLTIN
jgi:hypothetical protein